MKATPDHIIVLDLLIYTKGNDVEQEAWEDLKNDLKSLAHKKVAA